MHGTRFFTMLLAWGTLASVLNAEPNPPSPQALEFFEKQVRPLLAENCYTCHSADTKPSGGLRVDDRRGLLEGGGRGPAVVPGDPDRSLLIRAVAYDGALQMPPKKQLNPEQIEVLRRWVREGAVWPTAELPAEVGEYAAEYEQLKKQHWSWQPLVTVQPPEVRDAAWVRDDVDRYVLSRMEEAGLRPVVDADKPTLLRRVYFDLTGLPPSPADIDAFLADESAEAWARVVDRLLDSPAYGERWGRHWLDVARYGESTGSARNLPFPHAWRYRDYVISSWNRDKPFNQFLREQIAGDLLPANSPHDKSEQLVATGFLALGVKDVNQRFKVRYIMDNVDEQIDTVGRAILGLAVGCARCHDHKFDPIPTAEYYGLAGIFTSTDLCAGLKNKMGGGGLDYYDPSLLIDLAASPVATKATEKIDAARKAFEEARGEFQKIFGTPEGKALAEDGKPKQFHARQKMQKLQAEWLALTDPAANGPVAMGVRDAATVGDTELRVRGEAEKLGPVVPRGFLSLVTIPHARPVNPRQSGRLELAAWLTDDANPLTSRVIVNRLWQHLFGEGIVRTVDNFGVTGDKPSHPELLDHLALRFVRDGWSTKKLIRSLVLTHSYQLSSATSPEHLAKDPANRLVWRHSPRRLDAEEIRDASLAIAGKLSSTPPPGSPAQNYKVIELRNNGPEAKSLAVHTLHSPHRSVYLPLLRTLVPGALQPFDSADQGLVTGARETTTVPTQALYLLNDPFVRRTALNLAESLLADPTLEDSARITAAFRRVLGRSPSSAETDRVRAFLCDYESEYQRVSSESIALNVVHSVSSDAPATPAPATPAPATPAPATTVLAPVPANPDDPVPGDDRLPEEAIQPTTPRVAAWASFCQALLGSGEFRYVR